MQFEIKPVRSDFLRAAREEGLDDQRQQVKRVTAVGGEPCRDVLRRAKPGEKLLLASYCPFENAGPYREFGPVFILAEESTEKFPHTQLPITSSNGAESYLREQFVLRAYNAAEEIIDAQITNAADADAIITRMLSNDGTAFIQARFPTYGCYALRIER